MSLAPRGRGQGEGAENASVISRTVLSCSKPRILVVEDKPSEREALARLLKLEQYDFETADFAKQALTFPHEPIDLVISELKMSRSSGLDLLRYWKEQRRETPFIMVTAFGEVDSTEAGGGHRCTLNSPAC